MNIWTQKSIELANQKNYLDLLYRVYPISENARREISNEIKGIIKKYLENKNNKKLLITLLEQLNKKEIVFPIKDSYVSYLKHDFTAIDRNPKTVDRITSILYEMGYDEIIERATAPKEANRQMGSLFNNWIKKGSLTNNILTDENDFLKTQENAIYGGDDKDRATFATKHLGYTREKGIDLLAKFNGQYIMGEAKFLTDTGGSQNSDFEDAEATLRTNLSNTDSDIIKIAIIDGPVYIEKCAGQKIPNRIRTAFSDDEVILSAVLLRDYLYSL